jgi:hypothetical protein
LVEILQKKSADSAGTPCSLRANRSTEGQSFNLGANEITLSACREVAWPFKSKECLDKVRALRHSFGNPFFKQDFNLVLKEMFLSAVTTADFLLHDTKINRLYLTLLYKHNAALGYKT